MQNYKALCSFMYLVDRICKFLMHDPMGLQMVLDISKDLICKMDFQLLINKK